MWRKATSLVCKRKLVDIFYRIMRQMSVRVANLFLPGGCIWDPHFGEGEVSYMNQLWYHSKEVALHCDHCVFLPQFAVECPRRSIQHGVGQFG